MDPYIRIEGIKKNYGKRNILNGVSLTADPGMCVGILGSNGCGKSTLLSILAGELRADAGSFYVRGTDLLTDPLLRREIIGYAPQGTPLIAELTAYENLRLWYDKELLSSSLEDGPLSLLGIPGFLKTPVRKMSGGMKKRLSIGCAIAGDPKILLLDEPGAALDLLCKEAMENYFSSFLSGGGTIFLVTHDVQELRLCTGSCILKNGQLTPFTFDGDVRKLTEALKP